MKRKFICLFIIIVVVLAIFAGCDNEDIIEPQTIIDNMITKIDLSVMPDEVIGTDYEYLYDLKTVDDSRDYLAHPDSILLKNGNILTVYPAGHGKGAIVNKVSTDNGVSWTGSISNTPSSWENSEETPTVFRLEFEDENIEDKLILISGNPKWNLLYQTDGGFSCSISTDEGQTWSEFETFYKKDEEGGVIPIVAMASLIKLKENGEFVDKWMAVFHDSSFRNYSTILSFDENGNMQWSTPRKYFEEYRDIESSAQMCEVCIIRSDGGKGDELCLIGRSNSKKRNAIISFSQDEGLTWSEPKEVPDSLNGERHKVVYTNDGRLFITFRSIVRGETSKDWISEGWIAWVGTYDDLKNGNAGQYTIKIAHTYLQGNTQIQYSANGDTGYCGNVLLPDGTIVTSSYGCFSCEKFTSDNSEFKTSICSKRINLADIDALVALLELEETEVALYTPPVEQA